MTGMKLGSGTSGIKGSGETGRRRALLVMGYKRRT